MNFPAVIIRYRCAIINSITELVNQYSGSVNDTIKYHLGFWEDTSQKVDLNSGQANSKSIGKLVRATMVVIACEAARGEIERALPFSAIVELIHNASLIHDDIEDLDQFRHHRTTVWKRFGKPQSIISGNFAIKVAHVAVSNLHQQGIAHTRLEELHHKMTVAHLQMVEGQYIDIAAEQDQMLTDQQYLKLIDLKTGSLIAFSLYAGAHIGPVVEPDQNLSNALIYLGQLWGRLFQIQDDVIGVWGDERSGKPIGSDIKHKKKALPLIHLFQKSNHPRIVSQARKIIDQPEIGDADIHKVLDLMEQSGTRKWCEAQTNRYYNKAREQIKGLNLSKQLAADFNEIGEYLNTRMS